MNIKCLTRVTVTYNCVTFFQNPLVSAVFVIVFLLTAGRDAALPKTEVCLTLVNKFEVPENDHQDINKLFIR
jgi:hypothetical protein